VALGGATTRYSLLRRSTNGKTCGWGVNGDAPLAHVWCAVCASSICRARRAAFVLARMATSVWGNAWFIQTPLVRTGVCEQTRAPSFSLTGRQNAWRTVIVELKDGRR